MLQRTMLASAALLGLLGGAAANADDYRYRSEPQIRLGIDLLWGGYGPVYVAPPPVVYYPPHYRPPGYGYEVGYEHGYAHGYDSGYGQAKWRGKGHRRHRHHRHDYDD